MRIFGSDRLDNMLKKFGLEEGEVITHPWISKALEKAQARVEAHNFDIRKHLLKYDNVMNDQRKVVYEQRLHLMGTEDVSETVESMREDVLTSLLERCIPEQVYAEQWDVQGLHEELLRIYGLDISVAAWAREEGIGDVEMKDRIRGVVNQHMEAQTAGIAPETLRHIEKSIVLRLLDQHWKEHLLGLDYLRQGINLRAYAQKDPLREYQAEAFRLFSDMLTSLSESVVSVLAHFNLQGARPAALKVPEDTPFERSDERPESLPAWAVEDAAPLPGDDYNPTPEEAQGFILRNASCPCGSGKKYKYCHGKI